MAGKSFLLMKLLAKRRRNKIIILAIGGVGAVVAGLLLYSFSWPISALSHWPQVSPPELFVTSQPKQEDLPGIYLLTRQTITTNGLAAFEGRQCHLICGLMGHSALRIIRDGRRTLPPNLTWSRSSRRRATGVVILLSIFSYNGRSCWGVGFSDPRCQN